MADARAGGSDLARLTALWDDLGIHWADETADAEQRRAEYLLPGSLKIGAVLLGPGFAYHFFDAAGTYVGYGATTLHETDYFVERGRQGPSFEDYNLTRHVHEVRLQGCYIGVPETGRAKTR